jgi:hypothetical protein
MQLHKAMLKFLAQSHRRFVAVIPQKHRRSPSHASGFDGVHLPQQTTLAWMPVI